MNTECLSLAASGATGKSEARAFSHVDTTGPFASWPLAGGSFGTFSGCACGVHDSMRSMEWGWLFSPLRGRGLRGAGWHMLDDISFGGSVGAGGDLGTDSSGAAFFGSSTEDA